MIDIDTPGTPLLAMYYEPFCKHLDDILKGEDKTAYIRALEFLIKLVTQSDKFGPRFDGQIAFALSQYVVTDELTKLNIVELVPELAGHHWTSALLLKSGFLQALMQPDASVPIIKSRISREQRSTTRSC